MSEASDSEIETHAALEDKVAALEAEIAALKDQALRYAAEAENVKRRAEREMNDARAFAIQRFARDLLPVADNLSRALAVSPKEDADPALKNLALGIQMTEKELLGAFERNNLKRVSPARGDKFDPNFHQAMTEEPAEGVPGGAVVSVMQVGFELFGRIVRPALVTVATKTHAAPEASGYAAPAGEAPHTLDTQA